MNEEMIYEADGGQCFSPQNGSNRYSELGQLFAGLVVEAGNCRCANKAPVRSNVVSQELGLGLPGTEHIFDDENHASYAENSSSIAIPTHSGAQWSSKNITRLVKSRNGAPSSKALTALGMRSNWRRRQGVQSGRRVRPYQRFVFLRWIARRGWRLRWGLTRCVTRAFHPGDALPHDQQGDAIADRWIHDPLRDDAGDFCVGLSSRPPGRTRNVPLGRPWARQLVALQSIRTRTRGDEWQLRCLTEIDRRIEELKAAIEKSPYVFDRRLASSVFYRWGIRNLPEFMGPARPEHPVNGACACTARSRMAEDWIQAGRCRG